MTEIEPEVVVVGYGRAATDALRSAIDRAKGGRGLAALTVIVPSNLAGLSARRLIGGTSGLANAQFVTPFRFAELLSADVLTHRRPLTNPILASAVRRALADDPRPFGETAQHHATEAAVAALFGRVSHLSDASRRALAGDAAGQVALGLYGRVARHLGGFDDEDDVARAARQRPDLAAALGAFGHLVWYLPDRLTHELSELLRACLASVPSTVIAGLTGAADADAAVLAACRRAGVAVDAGRIAVAPATASRIVTTTDADEEVREVIRSVWTLAAHGTPLDRIAVVYPSASPYLRILRAQFDGAGLPVSGPSPERLADTVAGRVLTAALDLPAARWRRDRVMALVAAGPLRSGGRRVRPAAWERMSRQAGVVAGLNDWGDKLARSAAALRERADRDLPEGDGEHVPPKRGRLLADAAESESLAAFVAELAALVQAIERATTWRDRSQAARELLVSLLGGEAQRQRWPEHEQAGADRVVDALVRLAALDDIEPSPSIDAFRRAVDAELDSPGPRLGSFGTGVTLVPLAAATGLDLDAVFVTGMAEGLCPRARRDESLLPESVRLLTGGELETPDDALAAQHRRLLAALASAPADRRVLTFARGDLRSGSSHLPSRWLLDTATALRGERVYSSELDGLVHPAVDHVESFAAGIASRPAASEVDHDLATLVAGADPLVYPSTHTVRRAIVAQRARRSPALTEWDGNLAGHDVASPVRLDAMSPTRLETWAACGYRYFLQYVLHLDELEVPERIVELQPLDRGSAFHHVLEAFLREAIAAGPPAPGEAWRPEQRGRLHQLADAEFDAIERSGKTGRPLLWERRRLELHERLERFLDDDQAERRLRATTPALVEWQFGDDAGAGPVAVELEGGRTARFRGRVDRIDEAADGCCVVYDYKTGKGERYAEWGKAADADPLAGGTMLQHGVYAEAARQLLGMEPSASGYWLVERPKNGSRVVGVPWGPEQRQRLAEVTGAIVDGIEGGAFPVVPGDWDTFRATHENCAYCAYDRLCPVDRGEQADTKAVEIGRRRHGLEVEVDAGADGGDREGQGAA